MRTRCWKQISCSAVSFWKFPLIEELYSAHLLPYTVAKGWMGPPVISASGLSLQEYVETLTPSISICGLQVNKSSPNVSGSVRLLVSMFLLRAPYFFWNSTQPPPINFWKAESIVKLTGYGGDLFFVLVSILYMLIRSVVSMGQGVSLSFWFPLQEWKGQSHYLKKWLWWFNQKSFSSFYSPPAQIPVDRCLRCCTPRHCDTRLPRVYCYAVFPFLLVKTRQNSSKTRFKRRNSKLHTHSTILNGSSAFECKNHERIRNFRCD
jgi:hypothetical protein